jgi:hypothetical protein
MNDQDNRLYAVNLMNRAGVAFDARDVGTVAAVLGVIEGDVANWLLSTLTGTASRERLVRAVTTGAHRPQMEGQSQ